MEIRIACRYMVALLLLAILSPSAFGGDRNSGRADNILTVGSYRSFLANKVFSNYGNDGSGSRNGYTENSGFEYPAGSEKTLVFQDGIVWGGYSKGSLKALVGGSTYNHGVQAGRILVPGTATTSAVADDPSLPLHRVYSVRRQINPTATFDDPSVQALLAADTELESRYTSVTMQGLFDQYKADWMDWPADKGAPFQDLNQNGTYDPTADIPGVQGADQTLWYVANDMNAVLTSGLAGSSPIGIEMQRTIYGFDASGPLSSSIFCITRLINKSGASIDSIFIAQWTDPDVGDSDDDFVGCDTLLGLGYAYNGGPDDQMYGTAVPAVGNLLLQGPIVPGSTADTARFGGGYRPMFRNLPMSAFVFFVNGDTTYRDPILGPGGDVMWYRLLKGTISTSGAPFIDPTTSSTTKFCFSGDPLGGTGWVDGGPFVPGDRRMVLVTGPLTMAAGDTQEIVVATYAAQGTDRLSSVSLLKSFVPQIQKLFNNGVVASIERVDTLYPAHAPIALEGSGTTIGTTTPSLQWFLAEKPPASVAGLVVDDARHATLTPDTPGVYRVGLVASVPGAEPDTAFVDLHVTSVQKPVAEFTLNSVVVLGDTVIMDAETSHDPNGFPLALSWEVTGSRAIDARTPRDTSSGFLSSKTGTKVSFVPLRTASHSVRLEVKNGYFTSMLVKTFQVKPLATSNITLRGQLASATWPFLHRDAPGFGFNGLYGWGAIKEFSGGVWANDGGLCGMINFNDYSHPYRIYNMGGIPFDGGQNLLVATSSYVVNVLPQTGSGGTWFLPFSSFTPDSAVLGVVFKYPYILLPSRKAGILVYNIASQTYSARVGQYMNGEVWSSVVLDGVRLYGVHPLTKRVSIVNVANPSAITPVALTQLDRGYASITKAGPYFYLVEANTSTNPLTNNADTIAIYDLSNPGSPLLKGYIGVPRTFNEYNRFVSVAGYDSIVITSTAEGVYLFNVKDPGLPFEAGHFLTGSYFSSVFLNSSHMLAVNLNRVTDGDDLHAYEGLLDFNSPFTAVGEEPVAEIPTSVRLDQNFPNPFNPSTTIRYGLPQKSAVQLEVFNTLGQRVKVLVQGFEDAGIHEVRFDAVNLASGVYFYRLLARPVGGGQARPAPDGHAGAFIQTKRLLLLR